MRFISTTLTIARVPPFPAADIIEIDRENDLTTTIRVLREKSKAGTLSKRLEKPHSHPEQNLDLQLTLRSANASDKLSVVKISWPRFSCGIFGTPSPPNGKQEALQASDEWNGNTPHKGDSPLAAQAGFQADFTYSMSTDVITITDLDLGNRSVTNDIENVLRKIEYWHQGSIATLRIMYRDSLGVWDRVH